MSAPNSDAQVNADVNININTKDNASGKIESSADRITKQYREMRKEQSAVSKGFQLQHRTFTEAIDQFQSIGRFAGTATSMFQRYNVMQIRVTDAQRSLTQAQFNYNYAVQKYGATSMQALTALREEKKAQQDLNNAKQEAMLNDVALGLQGAGAVSQLMKSRAVTGLLGKLGGGGLGSLGGIAAGGLGTGALAGLGKGAGAAGILSSTAGKAGILGAIGVAGFLGGEAIANVIKGRNPTDFYVPGINNYDNSGNLQVGKGNVSINVNSNDPQVAADEIANMMNTFG